MKKEVPAAGASLLLQQGLLRQKEWCTGGIYVKILRRARDSRVKVLGCDPADGIYRYRNCRGGLSYVIGGGAAKGLFCCRGLGRQNCFSQFIKEYKFFTYADD